MGPYQDMPTPTDEYLASVLDADLRLLSLTERLRQHWAAHATALGLTAVQVKVLLRLVPGEATPMRKLARQLDYDASNLTTLVGTDWPHAVPSNDEPTPPTAASKPSCSPQKANAYAISSGATS